MPGGIMICGANGSGKSTLGKALAEAIGFCHMDIEEYYFLPSDIPYSLHRSREECAELMLRDIYKSGDFIITAVNPDFGGGINSLCRMAVYLYAPKEVRLERIKKRSFEKFGERAARGGDLFEIEDNFLRFAANRPVEDIEKRFDILTCPKIYADGEEDISENVKIISEEWEKICQS